MTADSLSHLLHLTIGLIVYLTGKMLQCYFSLCGLNLLFFLLGEKSKVLTHPEMHYDYLMSDFMV